MVDIVEQSEQNPKNATPVGWDPATLRFPGVNTCVCVGAIPAAPAGQLVGLHLGLYTTHDMIDDQYLESYIRVARMQAQVRGLGRPSAIRVAGALAVWRDSDFATWQNLRGKIAAWSAAVGYPPVTYHQFDDRKVGGAPTVDIVMTRGGTVVTATAGGGAVALNPF